MNKKKEKIEIEYPRHWHFSCSAFTCYLETDEDDNIGYRSTGAAKKFIGVSARKFGKLMNRKFGGVWVQEYDKDGRRL